MLGSSIGNTNVGFVYGDMQAHWNVELKTAHVEHCHSQGIIDDAMAVELLKG